MVTILYFYYLCEACKKRCKWDSDKIIKCKFCGSIKVDLEKVSYEREK